MVEWRENRDGVLFWKWDNDEMKKDSRLIIRPGQDAIFLYNGKIEGVFEEEGNFEIESQIIPFLTTLKSFKFGFNTPLRAEICSTCRWMPPKSPKVSAAGMGGTTAGTAVPKYCPNCGTPTNGANFCGNKLI